MNINRKPKVIDVKAMTKIGQMICEDYRPILELSRANILNDDYFKTSSIIRVSYRVRMREKSSKSDGNAIWLHR